MLILLKKPKFHLLRHVSVKTRQARRVVRVVTCCVVRAAPCLLQHGVRQRSSGARV